LSSYIDKHKSDRGDAIKPTPTQQQIQILHTQRRPIEIVDTVIAAKKRRFVLLPSYIDKHKSDRGDVVLVKPTPTQQEIQILIVHYSHFSYSKHLQMNML